MSLNIHPEKPSFNTPERTSPEIMPREGGVEQQELGNEKQVEREAPPHHEQVSEGAYGTVTAPLPRTDDMRGDAAQEHQATVQQIESILSEHLETIYADLPEDKKAEFKTKGEETARVIDQLLQSAKIRIKEIISAIVSWLRIIPGVNRFYIEQQAEIKANKLLALHDKQK